MSDSFIFAVGVLTTLLCGAFLVMTVHEIRKLGRASTEKHPPSNTRS